MKKSKIHSLILLIILILIIAGIAGERIFAEQLYKNNMIDSTEELSLKITEELKAGKDSFRTYVNGMSEEQLATINHSMDGFFGHVLTYTILRKINNNVMLVSFELEVSDNYYAYQYIVNDMPITEQVEAQVLAKKVEQIMELCQSTSEYQTVVNYHDYIVTNTVYGFIEGEDDKLSYTASGALLKGKAVCNGYAEAMELLLLCSGFDSYMAFGNTAEGSHAWNIVNIGGEWYHVDTTWDDPIPDMGDVPMHMYLNVNDEIIKKTHSWNESAYPECVSMDENYYKKENQEFDSLEALKNYVVQNIESEKEFEVMIYSIYLSQSDFEYIMQEAGAKTVSWQCYETGDYSVFRMEFQ